MIALLPLRAQAYFFYCLARVWGVFRKTGGDPNEPPGFGISWLWQFEEHPFRECSLKHDAAYNELSPGESTLQCDKEFLNCCLRLCKGPDDRDD